MTNLYFFFAFFFILFENHWPIGEIDCLQIFGSILIDFLNEMHLDNLCMTFDIFSILFF